MKIAHISDIHFCRERAKDVFISLKTLQNHIKENPVDLIAVSGDIFDSAIINSGSAEFPEFIEAIKRLGDSAPVAMVYGTPSHDVDGSLDVFKTLNCEHGITILDPGQAYMLVGKTIMPAANYDPNPSMLLFGIPEPRKKYLLAGSSAGKDETEAAVRDAMHKLCFMLAAKRKEYPAIPCVVLYHGDVAGSSLQNDQTVERGTGISITIDDLADIGADYYALGHIHKPQQVGDFHAYYAGSIYPKNFGETHKAGFNVVTTRERPGHRALVEVERIDFPHPQNLKIGTSDPMMYDIPAGVIEGRRVWLDITCSKEQRALINAEEELAELMRIGAAEGSRVTISDIPTETVRAAAITGVKTPAQKFEVWADNSEVTVKESVVTKINTLDFSIGAGHGAGLWELESVRLRGATGIKKGVGRDEITLDFTKFDDGLVALTGENGKGKTTLIENCHPYPQLLTRRGKLQDHFYLRDSLREVIYRNTQNNQRIKYLIQIDGQNKSGGCKYFIFANAPKINDEFEPFPGVDGNLKPYEDALLSMFGNLELYQRTAHIAQRPTKNLPDLTDATAGEKKALFVELAGIDYLQTIADAAREKAEAEAEKTHDVEIKAMTLNNALSMKIDVESELETNKAAIVKTQSELAEVTEAGKAAGAEVERLRELCAAERERQNKENEALKKRDAVIDEIDTLKAGKIRYEEAAKNKSAFEKQIAEYDALQKIIADENAKKQTVLEANMRAQSEYVNAKAVFDGKVTALENERVSLRDTRNIIERAIAEMQSGIKLCERDAAEINEDCPTCGQKLPHEKIAELEARRCESAKRIKEYKAAIKAKDAEVTAISERTIAIGEEIAGLAFEEPARPQAQSFDDAKLNETRTAASVIDVNAARKNLDVARDAAVRIEGITAQIADKNKLLEAVAAELERLCAGNNIARRDTEAELSAAQARHGELQEQYTACKAAIARYEAMIDNAKHRLTEIASQEKELAALTAEITTSKTEAAEWELIAKGFGKDGIQALELDALAPGISETANRILESAYGDRFRIEIQTTRIGGAGKKTKQIEDFLIYVVDAEDGEPVLLENKSGGEAVWIKRAIYDAFAVIRQRNTNFAFLTCFQDETDGALDSAAKTAYCRMLEAAHAESKLRHSIIITHSNEVKAMIEQKIDMNEFANGDDE